jgi:putative addiction module component (TIGR02574 family)
MDLLTHDEFVRLTPPERLTLISQLWDSLEDSHLPLTAAQRRELDRRLATHDEDRRGRRLGVGGDGLELGTSAVSRMQ